MTSPVKEKGVRTGAESAGGRRARAQPQDAAETLGRWLFIRRGWLPWLSVPVLFFGRSLAVDRGWQGYAAALLLIAAGEAVRIWSVGYAGTRTRTRSNSGRLSSLVTSGPFGHVRNPIYVGNLLMAAGMIGLFSQWLLLGPLLLLAFLAYQLIVRWEERMLTERFGDSYRNYLREVPRWLPRPARFRGDLAHPFQLKVALFSERGTMASTAIVLLLFGLKRWLWP